MEAPVLIKIKDHHLVNLHQITSIDLKGKIIFLSGSRYTEVSEEDLQRILKYCNIMEEDTKEIPNLHPF